MTNARITAAAESLFKKNGYRATSVNDIVRVAGTTATTFYRHFKSKAELAAIIQRELYAAVKSQTTKLEKVSTLQDIREWLNGYIAMWKRMHLLCDAYWEATLTDGELRRAILPDTMTLTAQLETFMARFPSAERERAQLRLAVLLLTLDRVAYLADSTDTVSEYEAILDEFALVMHRALSSD